MKDDFWARHKIGTRSFVVLILLILGVFSYKVLVAKETYPSTVVHFVEGLVYIAIGFVSLGLNGVEAARSYFKEKENKKDVSKG